MLPEATHFCEKQIYYENINEKSDNIYILLISLISDLMENSISILYLHLIYWKYVILVEVHE